MEGETEELLAMHDAMQWSPNHERETKNIMGGRDRSGRRRETYVGAGVLQREGGLLMVACSGVASFLAAMLGYQERGEKSRDEMQRGREGSGGEEVEREEWLSSARHDGGGVQ